MDWSDSFLGLRRDSVVVVVAYKDSAVHIAAVDIVEDTADIAEDIAEDIVVEDTVHTVADIADIVHIEVVDHTRHTAAVVVVEPSDSNYPSSV